MILVIPDPTRNVEAFVDIRRLPLADLDLSLARLRQLPESAIREKTESMRRKGQLSPLVAAEQDGALVLVDGFIRHQAALRLGLDALLVEVVRVSTTQMKCQVYLRNRERGLQLIEECRLVQELCDLDGLSQVEVADLLERHKSWVCRRLSLFRGLSSHLLADGALGLLPGGSLRRLAQLPPRNQEEVMAVAQRDGVPSQDIGALSDLFRRAPDPVSQRYVLDHPQDALARARKREEDSADPRLGEAGQQLLSGLMTIRQVSLRVHRRARDGIGAVPADGLQTLADATRIAEADCLAAVSAIRLCLSTT